jgi:hypothetical protein
MCWSACARCLARSNSVSTAGDVGVKQHLGLHVQAKVNCTGLVGMWFASLLRPDSCDWIPWINQPGLASRCACAAHPCVLVSAGTLQVARLLYLAAGNAGRQVSQERPCVMASLTSLPGAVSADFIATLLAHGIEGGCWEYLMPLLQLSAAKRVSSARLCRLLLRSS